MAYIYEFNEESLEGKSMTELLSLVEALFDKRDEYNKDKGAFDRQHSRDDSTIIKYFAIFNEVKKCVDAEDLTGGMENAMKLKIFMVQHNMFNLLVGDYAIAHLFGAITYIITSRFFSVLEKIEKQLKLENKFPTMALLDESSENVKIG